MSEISSAMHITQDLLKQKCTECKKDLNVILVYRDTGEYLYEYCDEASWNSATDMYTCHTCVRLTEEDL